MYQVLRIGKYDSPFGSVMTTAPSVLDAIREQEKREQNDIVYNYRNYVYPPEIIYNDDSISDNEKFRIKLLLEYEEFWDDTILR